MPDQTQVADWLSMLMGIIGRASVPGLAQTALEQFTKQPSVQPYANKVNEVAGFAGSAAAPSFRSAINKMLWENTAGRILPEGVMGGVGTPSPTSPGYAKGWAASVDPSIMRAAGVGDTPSTRPAPAQYPSQYSAPIGPANLPGQTGGVGSVYGPPIARSLLPAGPGAAPSLPGAPKPPAQGGINANGSNGMDYFFGVDDPQRAVDQALRELGVMPTSANPYTAFTRKQAAQKASPLFMMQQGINGGAGTSGDFRQMLMQMLQSGGNGSNPGMFDQAAQSARGLRDLLGGVEDQAGAADIMGQPGFGSRLALSQYMQDPRNLINMMSASSGMAPGMDAYLRSGLAGVYGGYEAMAPQMANDNIDFADYLARLGPSKMKPFDPAGYNLGLGGA